MLGKDWGALEEGGVPQQCSLFVPQSKAQLSDLEQKPRRGELLPKVSSNDSTLNHIPFLLLLYHISRKGHPVNFTPWILFSQVPREMEPSPLKRLSRGRGSSASIKRRSKTPSPPPSPPLSSGNQVSPGGTTSVALPGYSHPQNLEFSFFPPIFLFSEQELGCLRVQICSTFVQIPEILFCVQQRIHVSSEVHGDPSPTRLLSGVKMAQISIILWKWVGFLVMFFSSVSFLCIIDSFCWLGIWFTAQLWLHRPPHKKLCFEIRFNLSVISLPSRYHRFIFLNSFFGHSEKQERTLYHVALRVPGLRGADANLAPHREVMHSQEKLDVVEVLALQIPHPLQRIISSMKRVSGGFVGSAGSCNCVTVSEEDTTPAGGSQNPTGGWWKVFLWCQSQAEFAHPWVLSFGSKPENLLPFLICSRSGHTY